MIPLESEQRNNGSPPISHSLLIRTSSSYCQIASITFRTNGNNNRWNNSDAENGKRKKKVFYKDTGR